MSAPCWVCRSGRASISASHAGTYGHRVPGLPPRCLPLSHRHPASGTAIRPGLQQPRGRSSVRARSSTNSDAVPDELDAYAQGEAAVEEQDLGPRADDVLPSDLGNAVSAAAEATYDALLRGLTRCEVEILLPEFWDPISGPIFPNKGDQERFWKITRRFVEELTQRSGMTAKAVYPDAGVAAMLSYQWADRNFTIASLNDRRPVSADDELVVVTCADPPGADDCIKLVRSMAAQDEEAGRMPRPVILFNQRLSSGDVGLGLNARRMRSNFIKDFTITYSLRPIEEIGTVFRRYPGLWQVFLDDPAQPGRYRLAAEQSSRPQGEALDMLVQREMSGGEAAVGADGERSAPSFFDQVRATANSLQYFMKSLSK